MTAFLYGLLIATTIRELVIPQHSLKEITKLYFATSLAAILGHYIGLALVKLSKLPPEL